MFDKILGSLLKPVTNSQKKLHLRCLTGGFESVFNYLYLQPFVIFTKLLPICLLNLINITDSIVHGQIHVTLVSTYLLNNENYNGVS